MDDTKLSNFFMKLGMYQYSLREKNKVALDYPKSQGIYGALGLAYYKQGTIAHSLSCLEVCRKIEKYDDRIELAYGKSLYFSNQVS